MKRYAVLFLILILLPTVVLSILAWQTAAAQQALLDRQETVLRQQEVEKVAGAVRLALVDTYRNFSETALAVSREAGPTLAPLDYDRALRARWQPEAIGFITDGDGRLTAAMEESARQQPRLLAFLSETRDFLGQSDGPATGEFSRRLSSEPSGILGRRSRSGTELVFWTRPTDQPDRVLAARLDPEAMADRWDALLLELDRSPATTLALMNADGIPVARSAPRIGQPLDRPFAAVPVGPVLPGWNAHLYLDDPEAPVATAARLRILLSGLIGLAVLAICFGGGLLLLEARHQRELALKKTHFVSNVTHELKTPLTSIRLFAEMLTSGADSLSEPQRRYLTIIHAETERLRRLIDQVLDFSKLEKRRLQFKKARLDLKAWLRGFLDTHLPALEQSGCRVDVRLPADDLRIEADPDALAQILLNLLSNAEKYSPTPPGPEIGIEVSAASGRVRIDILDRGRGVPRGAEEKIFEQFYRAEDGLDSETQGTGLGLTLARGLARGQGGDIVFRSRPGGGSIFSVLWPRLE